MNDESPDRTSGPGLRVKMVNMGVVCHAGLLDECAPLGCDLAATGGGKSVLKPGTQQE